MNSKTPISTNLLSQFTTNYFGIFNNSYLKTFNQSNEVFSSIKSNLVKFYNLPYSISTSMKDTYYNYAFNDEQEGICSDSGENESTYDALAGIATLALDLFPGL